MAVELENTPSDESTTSSYIEKSPPTSTKYIKEFFNYIPCEYSDKLFEKASVLFDYLKLDEIVKDPAELKYKKTTDTTEKTLPVIKFANDNDKRLVYELVFSTLKFQRLFEEVLESCQFFKNYVEFVDHQGLVLVLLNKLNQRKFQVRREQQNDEEIDPVVRDVEKVLLQNQTKISAAIARFRINAKVLTLDELVPHSSNASKVSATMQVYCWVNKLKVNMDSVLERLHEEGFSAVTSGKHLAGKTYMLDHQCNDAIILPHDKREWLQRHASVAAGYLVTQDRSSCLGPVSAHKVMNEGDNAVIVNVGSGLSCAHLASLTHNLNSTILAFGIHSEKQRLQVTENLEKLGAKNRVKIVEENIQSVDLNEDCYKNIKVALLMADCSRSGVVDPVNFLVAEGEDMDMLKNFSAGHTSNDSRLGALIYKHTEELSKLLDFPQIQAVVYCTHSTNPAENENIVNKSLERINTTTSRKNTVFCLSPPVLALSQKEILGEDSALKSNYLKFRPSTLTSGCFVATIIQEPIDRKLAVKEVLSRAVAKGLISKVSDEIIAQNYISSEPAVKTATSKHIVASFRSAKTSSDNKYRKKKKVPGAISIPKTKEAAAIDKKVTERRQSIFTNVVQPAPKEEYVPEYQRVIRHPNAFR